MGNYPRRKTTDISDVFPKHGGTAGLPNKGVWEEGGNKVGSLSTFTKPELKGNCGNPGGWKHQPSSIPPL